MSCCEKESEKKQTKSDALSIVCALALCIYSVWYIHTAFANSLVEWYVYAAVGYIVFLFRITRSLFVFALLVLLTLYWCGVPYSAIYGG